MTRGPNPNAWNNWYPGVGSTYGTWIRGEPRGFRTHKHRFHVEGDYRIPPPVGVYAPIFEYTRKRMRYPPVRLTAEQRVLLCDALVDRLHQLHVEVVALAVAINHFHLLARFPVLSAAEQQRLAASLISGDRDPSPRHFLGLARKHASIVLADRGLKAEGPVWAVRPKFDPVRDRGHQVNLTAYIIAHVKIGAAVYRVDRGFIRAHD